MEVEMKKMKYILGFLVLVLVFGSVASAGVHTVRTPLYLKAGWATNAYLKAAAFDTTEIDINSSGQLEMPIGAVDSTDIADGTIGGTDIADSMLTGVDIATKSLGTENLADSLITGAKLGTTEIEWEHFHATEAFSTTFFDMSDATGIKPMGDSWTTTQITDSTIASIDVGTKALATENLADSLIEGLQVGTKVLRAGHAADSCWTGLQIETAAIETEHLAPGIIGGWQLAENGVYANVSSTAQADGANGAAETTYGTNGQSVWHTWEFDTDTADDILFVSWTVPDNYKPGSAALKFKCLHTDADNGNGELIPWEGAVNAVAAGETVDAAGTAFTPDTVTVTATSSGEYYQVEIDIEVEPIAAEDNVIIMIKLDESGCNLDNAEHVHIVLPIEIAYTFKDA